MREMIINLFKEALPGHFPEREIDQMIRIYLEDKDWINENSREDITQEVSADISELIKGRPIQYITGKTYFYDRFFHVDQNVLIPRPETEELVSLILEKHQGKKGLSILDVGTGSGCVPIILADKLRYPDIYSIDISQPALKVAQSNADKYGLHINFLNCNFLNDALWNDLPIFNIIVSNPPYIRSSEKSLMSDSVLKYEPLSALVPEGDDPLIFYKKIAYFGKTHLLINGRIYVEINEFLGPETVNVFDQAGYDTHLVNDMQGKPRIIEASIKL